MHLRNFHFSDNITYAKLLKLISILLVYIVIYIYIVVYIAIEYIMI